MPSRPTSASARRKASSRSRECVVYLAVAPKSNAVYAAYNAARAFISEDGSRPVPLRLRNAPTRLMKGLGYGKGYRYAHDEADAYAAGERYLPDDMPDVDVLSADRARARSAHRREAARAARAGRSNRWQARAAGRGRVKRSARIVRCSTSTSCATICRASPRRWRSAASRSTPRASKRSKRERKSIQTRTQELQAKRNALSQAGRHREGQGQDAEPLLREVAGLGDELKSLERELENVQEKLRDFLLELPNITHPSTPVGPFRRRQRRSAPLGHAARVRFRGQGSRRPRRSTRAARFRDGGEALRRALHVPARRSRAPASRARAVHARHAHARARLHRVLHAVHRQRGNAGRHRPSCRSSRTTCSRCSKGGAGRRRRCRST